MIRPESDGFYMPAEYSSHDATVMIWCERGGSWPYAAKYARPVFAQIIKTISQFEKVYLAVSKSGRQSAETLLSEETASGRVTLWDIDTDDCWARDTAPTFVTDGKTVRGVDWKFNAWGGDFDGLYLNYDKDDGFAYEVCKRLNKQRYDARHFVLEGGSVHSNGKGLIMTTEECLLSKGRNPAMTRAEIEKNLKEYLGAESIVWLPYGVAGDETNGHVDNICAFVNENTVVLGWTDADGEQKKRCAENLKVLKAAGLNVVKLPFPEKPVKITEFDLQGFVFEDGEDRREAGETLAASYVNFYVCNGAVLVPQFNDINDKVAVKILADCFKDRKIVPVNARDLIVGGGNIHCLTQQVPRGEKCGK